jgi:hypothetical protein
MLQTLDPLLANSLAAVWAGVLMVQAGLGKRLLSWRPEPVRRRCAASLRRVGRRRKH